LEKPAGSDYKDFPEVLREAVAATGKRALNREYPLHPDMVKLRFEDLLLEVGVKLLYASQPVDVLVGENGIRGVIIVNKSGRQVLECRLLVDATETALVARQAGERFQEFEKVEAYFSSTIEFYKTGKIEKLKITVPADLGLEGNSVMVHKGYRGSGHVLVECSIKEPTRVNSPLEVTRREFDLRDKAIRAAGFLKKNIPAFRTKINIISLRIWLQTMERRYLSKWISPFNQI
jgi:hypothetical protein